MTCKRNLTVERENTMRSCQDCLFSAIQQQQEGRCQLDAWVCHNHTRHLQSSAHTCSAVRCACTEFEVHESIASTENAGDRLHLSRSRQAKYFQCT